MNDDGDPWVGLDPPQKIKLISARRTSPDGSRDLFWAVDADGHCLLLMRHAQASAPKQKLPKLRGLVVETQPEPGTSQQFLILRLLEKENRELFHRLCLDIIAATSPAVTEGEAIDCFLTRAWRWHRMLSGGVDDRLSDEEQKGLIGELEVLREQLLPILGSVGAVEAWTGPLGAPKDFEIGLLAVEVKARRGAAVPQVLISSEHQLDTSGVDALFLQVVEVTAANSAGTEGSSLNEIVADLRTALADPSAVILFEERLAGAGFDAAQDYADRRWLIGSRHLYRVADGFPRVTPPMHPAGVAEVRYAISLPACEEWRVDSSALAEAVKESCCHVGH